ncbi:hypothetical protein LDENG_00169840 [Lucifuga dentata]|nr:hypothetical protein LDENG_00169840 [Lucifuga dentata]
MRSAGVPLLLVFLLVSLSHAESPEEPEQPSIIQQIPQPIRPQVPPGPTPVTAIPTPMATNPTPMATNPSPVATSPAPKPKQDKTDEFLGPSECLEKKFTRASCDLVFCLPWERCIEGQCSCKMPYMCPTEGVTPVCGRDNRQYRSYCQAMALSCRTKRPVMSHFRDCRADGLKFRSSVAADTGVVKLFIPDDGSSAAEEEEVLVCKKLWNMAAANVACREHGQPLGAASADSVPYRKLKTDTSSTLLPGRCVSVWCQGYETSLAECVIYDKTNIADRKVATVTCYQPRKEGEKCEFTCVNGKRVFLNQTCNGVDDCGDRSDEMCCKSCRSKAFRCSTGVCVHEEAIRDEQIDCLDGEDESEEHTPEKFDSSDQRLRNTEYTSPKNEVTANRKYLESKLYCGIPNATTVDDEEEEKRGRSSRSRIKRVVGGAPAKPTQIQWQVALEERGKVDCGGAYIGGCWVVTAAHCVRPNPSAFRVKFSLWKKYGTQKTTDIVFVKDIHIHPKYDPATYENDIALVQLQNLPFTDNCVYENAAISAICVPWTPRLFHPNHTCTISGWGRTTEGKAAVVLRWANVSLIADCQAFYHDRFKPGMMCAGDLDGSVDSCQGDSGGPLVCKDELGVSYLWGIVSWGERCGQRGFPGVYTQVAHYFEWIRRHTGWPAVTRFNS